VLVAPTGLIEVSLMIAVPLWPKQGVPLRRQLPSRHGIVTSGRCFFHPHLPLLNRSVSAL
jgi:hypothetical protein